MSFTTQNAWFNPLGLMAAVRNANLASFTVAHEDARLRRHNTSKSDVRLKVFDAEHAQLQPKGLQAVFELGRKAGYPINAGGAVGLRKSRVGGVYTFKVRGASVGVGGQYLGFNNTPGTDSGTGVRYGPVLGGKMSPYPAMKPAAVDWARRGYGGVSRRVLAAQGYPVRL